MVRRLFWVALGAGAGVLIVRQVTKTARRYTPSGVADRVSSFGGTLGDSLRDLLDDIREAAGQREVELYQALGIEAPSDAGTAGADRALPGRASEGRPESEPETP